MNLVIRGGARLRWQSQPRRNSEGSDYAEVEQETSWQALAGMDLDFSKSYSTGTTYSLDRIILSFDRAANSIARGSVFNLSTSFLRL